MSSKMRIRTARPDDSAAIAATHLAAWDETYRGLLPDELIAEMTLDRRAALWSQLLVPSAGLLTLVIEDVDGIAGFGRAGPNRDAPASHLGEIQSIYLLARAQGRGQGRALITSLADHLDQYGLFPALVWVLEGNLRARGFYQALGAVPLGHRSLGLGDASDKELSYSWPARTAFR